MNANELADIQAFKTEELTMWERNHTATMLRQQQAEIEALKKRCLDEIFKTTYADRSAEVMCEQWEKAQSEIEALKAQILIWENAEVPVEVMADIIEELEKRGFITK